MADTCCAGKNWKLLTATGFTCDVFPFKEGYAATTNVPVATCATLITDTYGQSFILIGHEMLYFGSAMERSLLNQNQIRHYGGTVQDDYTRTDEEFGIHLDGIFIPFEMTGTTISFDSRFPSDQEIDDLPHIVMTSPDTWKPKEVTLRHISKVQSVPVDRRNIEAESDLVLGQISSCYLEAETNLRIIASAVTTDRHSVISAENMSKKWKIGIETAKRTMQVTTQRGIRTAMHPITRRYRVDHLQLHKNRLNSHFYCDSLVARTKSLQGNNGAQVYTNGKFTAVYPWKLKSDVGQTLSDFCADVGIPEQLTADLAGEQSGMGTDFLATVRQLRIDMHWTEKGRKNQNHHAEREIGILKERWKQRMTQKAVPKRLWDYGIVYESEILSRISRGHNGRTGYEELTGNTPEIGEWLDFEFYDLVWCHFQSDGGIGQEVQRLGRWLGISHRIGSDMCYWILLNSGKVVSSTTVQHVTRENMDDPDTKSKIDIFNQEVNTRLDDTNFQNNDILPGTSPYLEDILDTLLKKEEENGETGVTPPEAEYADMIEEERKDADEYGSSEEMDKYIGAQLLLDIGGEPTQARVIKRSVELDGTKKGNAHRNPIFDTRAYMVELGDGSVAEYTANIIAENVYAQIDSEGRQQVLMKEISDFRKDGTAIAREDGFNISRNGNKTHKPTTRGWQLLVEWKDGTSDWVALKDLKESNPIEVAEFAMQNQIHDEPAFAWWVNTVIKHKNRIISKVKSKYWKTSHKFGIKLPHTVDEALAIDRQTGTNFWAKAIDKELGKIKVAWEARDDLTPEEVRMGKGLIGYTEIKCHMIFDVKMDFTRKARFVAGGHMTDAPISITYSSVVSRDSVRIAFLYAALNDLDILTCDISNAYLNAPCREKIWFLGGSEAGEDRGKVLVMVRAIYGLKSSGASWRSTLAKTIEDMGYTNTTADPDVWRCRARRTDGSEYYEILLSYVDDILCVSEDPKKTIKAIGDEYEIKEGSEGRPDTFLGAQIYRHHLPNGTYAWAMSSEKYIKNAINTVETLLDEDEGGVRYHLKTTAKTPFPTSYKPELDLTKELGPAMMSRYRQLIGILRWSVEIGRLDVYLETALLSQYLASPREGHLEALYHIFAYLKANKKCAVVFDPAPVELDEGAFANVTPDQWRDFYGDLTEELPPRMPEPLGKAMDITCFVDADHAGNIITRRSHTGILIFIQNAPIIWWSKKQNTVESSSFGSEFVALRTARDMIVALRYKLRMFGIPITGPASVLCDNQGVVKNASLPESTLSKRHNAINYHSVREAVAAQILRVGKEDGETNLADPFTKVLGRMKRYDMFSKITYSSMYGKEGPPVSATSEPPLKKTRLDPK